MPCLGADWNIKFLRGGGAEIHTENRSSTAKRPLRQFPPPPQLLVLPDGTYMVYWHCPNQVLSAFHVVQMVIKAIFP